MFKKNFRNTIVAASLGYVTQAIMLNFPPLLFVFFQEKLGLSLAEVSTLISANFITELIVDAVISKTASKIGYRPLVITADLCATLGLLSMFILPALLADKFVALILSMILCGLGGGLMEVLISPIVEACPTKNKSAIMSLLHSFYCWGQVAVVLISTVFFLIFSIEDWAYLAVFWTLIPVFDLIMFTFVPLNSLVEEGKEEKLLSLMKKGIFWILILMMLCAGASELAMSQWASAFAEDALGVEKWLGDLLGPCLFAIMMGTARVFYAKNAEKINLKKGILISSLICIASYLIAIFAPFPILSLLGCALCGIGCGLLWPGSFSIASERIPRGGVLLFGVLALAGDGGALFGPSITGFVASSFDGSLKAGFIAALIFPTVLAIITLVMMLKDKKRDK